MASNPPLSKEQMRQIEVYLAQYLGRNPTAKETKLLRKPEPIELKIVVIEKICNFIDRHGKEMEGIFRVPGSKLAIVALWTTFDLMRDGGRKKSTRFTFFLLILTF